MTPDCGTITTVLPFAAPLAMQSSNTWSATQIKWRSSFYSGVHPQIKKNVSMWSANLAPCVFYDVCRPDTDKLFKYNKLSLLAWGDRVCTCIQTMLMSIHGLYYTACSSSTPYSQHMCHENCVGNLFSGKWAWWQAISVHFPTKFPIRFLTLCTQNWNSILFSLLFLFLISSEYVCYI